MNIIAVGVVDDDDEVRSSLESLLRSVGYVPLCFEHAEAFLASEHRTGVDCVVTDLHMPGISGLELQKALIRMQPSLPVILMTAYPTDSVREEAEALGVAGFFAKPINGDMLIDKLEELLC